VNGGIAVPREDGTVNKVLQCNVWQIRLCHLNCNTGAHIVTKRITKIYKYILYK